VKLPPYKKVVGAAIIVSLIVPVGFFAGIPFDRSFLGVFIFLLWPTVLFPHEGYEDPDLANRALLFSALANVLLFVSIFSAFWGIAWLIRGRKRSSNESSI
jgi:hypothetical protein